MARRQGSTASNAGGVMKGGHDLRRRAHAPGLQATIGETSARTSATTRTTNTTNVVQQRAAVERQKTMRSDGHVSSHRRPTSTRKPASKVRKPSAKTSPSSVPEYSDWSFHDLLNETRQRQAAGVWSGPTGRSTVERRRRLRRNDIDQRRHEPVLGSILPRGLHQHSQQQLQGQGSASPALPDYMSPVEEARQQAHLAVSPIDSIASAPMSISSESSDEQDHSRRAVVTSHQKRAGISLSSSGITVHHSTPGRSIHLPWEPQLAEDIPAPSGKFQVNGGLTRRLPDGRFTAAYLAKKSYQYERAPRTPIIPPKSLPQTKPLTRKAWPARLPRKNEIWHQPPLKMREGPRQDRKKHRRGPTALEIRQAQMENYRAYARRRLQHGKRGSLSPTARKILEEGGLPALAASNAERLAQSRSRLREQGTQKRPVEERRHHSWSPPTSSADDAMHGLDQGLPTDGENQEHANTAQLAGSQGPTASQIAAEEVLQAMFASTDALITKPAARRGKTRATTGTAKASTRDQNTAESTDRAIMPHTRSRGSQSPTDAEVAAMQVKLDHQRAKLAVLRQHNELLRQLKHGAEKAAQSKSDAQRTTTKAAASEDRARPSRGKRQAVDPQTDGLVEEQAKVQREVHKPRRRPGASTIAATVPVEPDSPEDQAFYTARSTIASPDNEVFYMTRSR